MTEWYSPTEPERLLGYKAIKHRITRELCLFCKYGEVWQHSPTSYSFLITSTKIANKIARLLNTPRTTDALDEMLILDIDEPTSKTIIQHLTPPKNVSTQLRRSNTRK